MKGGRFRDIKKIPKKSLIEPKTPVQTNFCHGQDSKSSFCLADLKKSSKNLEAEEATLVWQLVVASIQSL